MESLAPSASAATSTHKHKISTGESRGRAWADGGPVEANRGRSMLPEDAFEEARCRTSSIVKAARSVFDLARTTAGSNALSRPKRFMAFGALLGASLPLYGVVLLGVGDDPSLERVGIWVHQRAWVIALACRYQRLSLPQSVSYSVGDSTALFFLLSPIR